MIPSWAQSGLPLVAFLFLVVSLRSQGTYWLARALPASISKWGPRAKRLEGIVRWVDGPVPRKGAQILEHWGIVAIPLSFLTVGLQTAILAGAGLVRMNWAKFTLAALPGCIAWAFLYGFGLLAVWITFWKAAAGNPYAWAAIAALVGCLIVYTQRNRIRRAALSTVGVEG